ncbi:MAG: hypothetical protein QXH60_02740 [Candidatus Pacearchaeota archaeon]
MNRSKYLAEYLEKRGYETKYGGINFFAPNPLNKFVFKWADIVVFSRKKHYLIAKIKYLKDLRGKKIIILDVIDNPAKLSKINKKFTSLSYYEFQRNWTYPELRRQIKEYMPL